MTPVFAPPPWQLPHAHRKDTARVEPVVGPVAIVAVRQLAAVEAVTSGTSASDGAAWLADVHGPAWSVVGALFVKPAPLGRPPRGGPRSTSAPRLLHPQAEEAGTVLAGAGRLTQPQ